MNPKYDKMTPKVSVSLLYPYFAQAELLGFDRSFILAELGVTEDSCQHAMTRISFSYFLETIHKLIQITASPSLGLFAGGHFHPSTYGPLAYLMLNSATIRQAYRNLLFYEPIVNEAVITESFTIGQTVCNQISYPGSSDQKKAPVVEAHVSSLIACTKFLSFRACGGKTLVKEILFKHSPQADPEKYKKYFGVEVKFNQKVNRFGFDSAILDYRIPGADPRMVDRTMMELNSIQAFRRNENKFKADVYDFVREGCSGVIPTATDAAKAFAMSLSTFQRRLKDESTTFKDLVDQVRMDKAEIDLADLRLNLSDVASRLGYSDAPAFFKAFKRWTGETPASYRKKISHSYAGSIEHN